MNKSQFNKSVDLGNGVLATKNLYANISPENLSEHSPEHLVAERLKSISHKKAVKLVGQTEITSIEKTSRKTKYFTLTLPSNNKVFLAKDGAVFIRMLEI